MKLATFATLLFGAHTTLGARLTHKRRNTTARLHDQDSANWAGAVLVGSGYASVTGTFTVPTPSVPSGGTSGMYAASAWVGIDGDTAAGSILQTGVDFRVESDGTVSFDAWYEWYPAAASDFADMIISAGDVVKLTVNATTPSSGIAVIENQTTGQTVTQAFANEENPLQEFNAEWIVEDFEENGALVPLADFGTVVFSEAVAVVVGSGGNVVQGPADAGMFNLDQQDNVLSDVSVTDDSVTVVYV